MLKYSQALEVTPQPTVKTDPWLSQRPSETRVPLPLRTLIPAGDACVEVTGQPDPVKPGDQGVPVSGIEKPGEGETLGL